MKTTIWSEKFRPQEVKQLVLPTKTKQAFEEYIVQKQIPNILLYGPPGSGKTTLGMLLLKKIASRKLVLNASSEDRGINTIKIKVKQFAGTQRSDPKKLNIVLFDEADGLTGEAQDALKNTIDTYHKNCRFILTCNQIDKIIDPIVSRCILFEFDTFPIKKVIAFSEKILKDEDVKYNIRDIKKIANAHYPDIRAIINMLQISSIGGRLDFANITIDTGMIKKYLLSGDITNLRHLWKNKVDFTSVFKYLFNVFIPEHMKDDVKPEAAVITAEYLYRSKSIVDKEINCAALCIEIMNLMDVDINFRKKKD